MSNTQRRILILAVVGVLVAVNIVLARFFSFRIWSSTIGFAFVTVAVAARVYGPVPAMLVAGLGDFVGAILFPIGPYFPGFTLTAVLTALCTSLFVYRKVSFGRVVASVLINEILGSLLLNTYWISVLYGKHFMEYLLTRVVQVVLMIIVEVVVMQWLYTKGDKVLQKIKI